MASQDMAASAAAVAATADNRDFALHIPSLGLPPPATTTAPHVTISNDVGSVVHHYFPADSSSLTPGDPMDPAGIGLPRQQQQPPPPPPPSKTLTVSSNRSWRSHSLTPIGGSAAGCYTPSLSPSSPGSASPSSGSSGLSEWQKQVRSHSLTLTNVRDSSAGVGVTFHASSGDSIGSGCGADGSINELVRRLPEGSGMRELHEWLKSLRLHKYTRLLIDYKYEELLTLSEADLEKKKVTTGARGKILKEVAAIRERPARIRDLSAEIDAVSKSNDLAALDRLMPELEKVILMPLKPCSASTRHDSGNSVDSSGSTELPEQHVHQLGYSLSTAGPAQENIPADIFELLKKVCSLLMLADNYHHVVVAAFINLLERCMMKEAFTSQQKHHYGAWLQRLKTVWNPQSVRKANEYKRKNSRVDVPTRRPSIQTSGGPTCSSPVGVIGTSSSGTPSPGACSRQGLIPPPPGGGGAAGPPSPIPGIPPSPCGFIRATSPLGFKLQQQQQQVSPQPPLSLSLLPDRGGGGQDATTQQLQRRSVPDINPSSLHLYPQIKRNSYQGDHRMTPLIDSEILSNLIDDSQHQMQQQQQQQQQHRLSIGIPSAMPPSFGPPSPVATSPCSRRESTLSNDSGYTHMSSLPDSRRDSQLSNECPGSRRDSRRESHHQQVSIRRSSSQLSDGIVDLVYHLVPGAGAGNSFVGGGGVGGGQQPSRRDSAMSNDSLLSVESAKYGGGGPTPLGLGGTSPGGGLGGIASSRASSGCASADGSTDSLLEQDLHKLSLSVTEQALE